LFEEEKPKLFHKGKSKDKMKLAKASFWGSQRREKKKRLPPFLGSLPHFPSSFPLTSPDSKLGLIPFHSPLLRESLLVSFPPLTDMLKFSG